MSIAAGCASSTGNRNVDVHDQQAVLCVGRGNIAYLGKVSDRRFHLLDQ